MSLVHYSKWHKNKKISPHSLLLDPLNYRLDHKGEPLSQVQIREALIEKENIKELASSIVAKGYMPVEDIIIVREGGNHLVVEGNRRVCAFQLLSKPHLSPKRHRRTFQNLHEKAGDELPKRLYCVIAPNRAEANVYIYSKHADDGFSKKWQRIRQAAFISDKLNAGSSFEDVVAETGMSRQRILESLAALDLFRLAGSMDLPPKAKQTLTDPSTFPFTALAERIFGSEEIRALLGVKLGSEGLIGVKGDKESFLKEAMRPIFVHVGDGDEPATRLFGTKEKAIIKIKELGYEPKGTANWAVFSASDAAANSVEEATPASGGAGNRKPKKQRLRHTLLPADLVCDIGDAKLAALVEEAVRLSYPDFPHASAILLRSILELSLFAAIAERKCGPAIAAKHKRGRDTLELGTLLEEVKQAKELDLGLDDNAKRGLKHLVDNGPLSHDMLNLYVHNPHWPATPDSVKAFRENILPILRKALLKPAVT